MQVTLGNIIVAGVVLFVGRVLRVLSDAVGKSILHELKSLNVRASWIDGLMKRYPNPEVLLEKLAKINGHKDNESVVTTTEKTTNFK